MMLPSFLTTRNAAMYVSARSWLIAFAHGNADHCVRRDMAGNIVLSFKRWLTYHAFTDEVVIWQADRIRELVALTPHIHPITPLWQLGFQMSAINFIDTLEPIIVAEWKEANLLNELIHIYSHGLQQYMPTGNGLHNMIRYLRSPPEITEWVAGARLTAGLVRAYLDCASFTLAGSDAARQAPALQITCESMGVFTPHYCTQHILPNTIVIIRPTDCTLVGCPIQLAECLQAVYEDSPPFIMVQMWQPLVNSYKHVHRVNIFGTLLICITSHRI